MSITKKVVIRNKYGIHVRPSGLLAKEMRKFPDVSFEIDTKDGDGFRLVDGIMSLVSFELGCGKEILLRAIGDDAEAACESVGNMFGQDFEFEP